MWLCFEKKQLENIENHKPHKPAGLPWRVASNRFSYENSDAVGSLLVAYYAS